LWAIARADLGLTDIEFLQMIPAALELLMRRLQVRDRKALHGAAMICAEVWNAAGKELDRQKLPDGMAPKDFLPELPEERIRREADEDEEEEARKAPPDATDFARFKEGLLALTRKK
jgi:hypothetical protein